MITDMDFKTAVKELGDEASLIGEAYSKEPNLSRRSRLRATRGKIRDEIFELVEKQLHESTAAYKPLNERFKQSKADLDWVQKQASTFKLNAARAAKLAELAGKFAALL